MNYVSYRYKHMWKRLKQKFFPKPSIFIIHGSYRVEYESGYDWVIGYRKTKEEAELQVSIYKAEVSYAYSMLKKFKAAKESAWAAYRKCDYTFYEDSDLRDYEARTQAKEADPEYQRLEAAYREADNALRDKVDEIMETMLDQDIPYPYSQLVGKRGPDGPLDYYYEEVLEIER